MPDATPQSRRAQYTYARGPWKTHPPALPRVLELLRLPPEVLEKIDRARSLDARLVLYFGAHSADHPCRLSAPALAIVFCPRAKHGARQVRAALARIRLTYRERFRERRRHDGSLILHGLAYARWIEPTRQGGVSYGDLPDQGSVASDHLIGSATRARPREVASRSPRPRSRARLLDLPPNPAFLAGIEAEVAAVRARFGREAGAVVRDVVGWPRYLQRPEETSRALRTLVQREPHDSPLKYFRGLFRLACAGELLCDAEAEAERIREAELDERRKDPDFEAAARADYLHVRERRPTSGRVVRLPGGAAIVVHRALDPPDTPIEIDAARCDALDRDERPR